MKRRITQVILLGVGLTFLLPRTSAPQSDQANLLFEVFFLDDPLQMKGVPRLWLKITSRAQHSRTFCRVSGGYTQIPADQNLEGFAQADTSVHGCDATWKLLPGESRIDAIDIKAPPGRNVQLLVDVSLAEFSDGLEQPINRDLSWKGQLQDALRLGDRIRKGLVKQPIGVSVHDLPPSMRCA